MDKVTIKDVAILAGVSVGTASMAINDSPRISVATKASVLAAVEKLNYRRNPFARSLSTSSSRTIGCLVPDLQNPFFGNLAGCLQIEAEKHGYGLMLGLTSRSSTNEARIIDGFIDRGVDALFVVPVTDGIIDINHLIKLKQQNYPLVFISSYYKQLQMNYVMTDLRKGQYLITKKLLAEGYKSLVLIAGNPDQPPFALRIEGFKDAFNEIGLNSESYQIVEAKDTSLQGGYAAVEEAFAHFCPDAILAINDVMALGIIGALRARGLYVPNDIAVAGFDNLSISGILETPLSTVNQPIQEICREGMNMMKEIMKGASVAHEGVLLEPDLVLRKSTRKRE